MKASDLIAVVAAGLSIAIIASIGAEAVRVVAIVVALALGAVITLFVWVLRQEPRPKAED